MKLSIIIVSWNVCEKLKENLKAIFDSDFDFTELEIFVVDNNSQDGTLAMLKDEFPSVTVIANQDNLGFAAANNQAIGRAHGEYILLLNPDMRVRPDTLRKMTDWMDDNQQASVAGCRLVKEDGELIRHVRRFPGVWDQAAIILKLPHLFPHILNKYIPDDFDYGKAGQVDSIRGGFFMVRAKRNIPFWLDERYFLWFEEVDFCRQVKKSGEQVWFTPVAECIDHVGQSFKQVGTVKKQKYFRDSMLKYFKKWHPVWQYYLLKIAWIFGLLISYLNNIIKIKSQSRT